jgi:hypothetical protein
MTTNLDRYKDDLTKLIAKGEPLLHALQYEYFPKQFEEAYEKARGKAALAEFKKTVPRFAEAYQDWYSEAKQVIKQLLPDRLDDFVRHYEKPKSRREINHTTYTIEDCLQNNYRNNWDGKKIVGPDSAIPHVQQQLLILKSVEQRFESSLFDIRQLVQADLFDSEIDAARALHRSGFQRAAGAVAGVVLEKHLEQVCTNHGLKVTKKNPTINDLNQLLKDNDVIDTPQWRRIQHLADIRNLCDHSKQREPTADEITDLIDGVEKTIKTLF